MTDVPKRISQDAVTLVEKTVMAVGSTISAAPLERLLITLFLLSVVAPASSGQDVSDSVVQRHPNEASGSANEASGSANEASGPANEASGSANEASGSANEASGSANEASGPADDDVLKHAVLVGKAISDQGRFKVPDGADIHQLFAFIRSIRQDRSISSDSCVAAARAVASAAEAIRRTEGVSLPAEEAAVREQLASMRFLASVDRSTESELRSLVSSLQADPREGIAKIADFEAFKFRIRGVQQASRTEQMRLVEELKALLENHKFDRDAFSVSSLLARGIGYTVNADLAAELYDDLAAVMSQSQDESIKARAEKMVGAARLMRLPGKFMNVSGVSCDGEEFQWDQYRGKVVLVHFWASWCRRCRDELPHLKRVLDRYGDSGFAIVGINLDRRLESCQEFCERENIDWQNVTGREDSERGWNTPLAKQYGISAIPTSILVDNRGHVLSLNARGENLDRLLADQLTEPAVADSPRDAP